MMKNRLRFSCLFAIAAALSFVACDKFNDRTEDDIFDFVDETLYEIQDRGNIGQDGCYELVFPVSIVFEDGSIAEVNDYNEARAAIRAWKEENPEATERPTLAFPIEVISEEGEVISVADTEELRVLREDCPRNYFDRGRRRGHRHRCNKCFSIVFPVTISFPDDTSVEVADRQELKMAIRVWKQANPDVEERPSLTFPFDVELEDGTIQTINSQEEFQALKESCAGD